MKQMTVKELILHLAQLAKSNPEVLNKYIVVADDNEGNSYHGLFYGITSEVDAVRDCIEFSNGISDSQYENPEQLVILG